MSNKTNKSYTKRVRVTRSGKLVARKPGQNHFNAKDSGEERLVRRRETTFNVLTNKTKGRFIPHNK